MDNATIMDQGIMIDDNLKFEWEWLRSGGLAGLDLIRLSQSQFSGPLGNNMGTQQVNIWHSNSFEMAIVNMENFENQRRSTHHVVTTQHPAASNDKWPWVNC